MKNVIPIIIYFEFQVWNCGGGRNGGVNNVLTLDNENDLGYIVENDTILGALYKQIHNDQNITVLYDSRVNQCSLPNTSKELATVKVANGDTTFETSLLVCEIHYEFSLMVIIIMMHSYF